MHYILDRFHASGHIDPWCRENVWPDTEENQQIAEGVNTSRCESEFRWFARKSLVYRMMLGWERPLRLLTPAAPLQQAPPIPRAVVIALHDERAE
eukprot:870166-Karenia_brevis.AAC.1